MVSAPPTTLAAAHYRAHGPGHPERCFTCHSGEGVVGWTQVTLLSAWDAGRWVLGDRHEPLLQNVRVVVDRNDNGIAERGEKKYRTDSAGRFNTFMPYGRTRLKVMIPARYRKLGLFSHESNVKILSSADAAGLLIALRARKR